MDKQHQNPLFSFVIVADALQNQWMRTAESVLEQDYSSVELLLINNGVEPSAVDIQIPTKAYPVALEPQPLMQEIFANTSGRFLAVLFCDMQLAHAQVVSAMVEALEAAGEENTVLAAPVENVACKECAALKLPYFQVFYRSTGKNVLLRKQPGDLTLQQILQDSMGRINHFNGNGTLLLKNNVHWVVCNTGTD